MAVGQAHGRAGIKPALECECREAIYAARALLDGRIAADTGGGRNMEPSGQIISLNFGGQRRWPVTARPWWGPYRYGETVWE